MSWRRPALAAVLVVGLLFAGPTGAQQDVRVTAIADYVEANVRPWLAEPAIVNAVIAQNAVHSRLNQAEIQDLDARWRVELLSGKRPLIDATLSNPLSLYLKGRQRAAEGLITEIFVMDNRGLNVGQSDITSDYWQGDEAKWLKSFGAGMLVVEEAERDESTQLMQSQASLPIRDPRSGAVIGAITVGVNLDAL
ncbi:hypothetical protein MUO32_05430 [Shinella sp. CPCC 101442]|uniref:hypothetical protein n=1 Tax=Shinella sp. CPCC 101442 TaxID=2932265 RepID=UPI00215378E2|nr:hypothetical protein [Shinella sp. CPCC 101442]MCR6498467.1 hypothetical protein [Shinella sp. CPCC 101442]